jgi:hypothetical protein
MVKVPENRFAISGMTLKIARWLKEDPMRANTVSSARTRAFARVIGPYLVIATGIIFVQAPGLMPAFTSFFANPALVFITAAFMLLAGVFIIANHQYWSSITAVIVSVFGWLLVLRALALMLFPKQYEAVGLSADAVLIGRSFFGVVFPVGLWLTWAGWKPAKASA